MQKNNYPGKFIVFEGLDGSGSSTQVSLLADYFTHYKIKFLLTKEPTNNIIGGLIKGQLTKDWQTSIECLQLLFAADRAHHLEKQIIPALKQGVHVISDRYYLSTIAFGTVGSLEEEWLYTLNQNFLEPDLIILLKVAPKVCISRMKATRFKMELFEEEKKLTQIWQAYERAAQKNNNVFLVDGEKRPEAIISKILVQVAKIVPGLSQQIKFWA